MWPITYMQDKRQIPFIANEKIVIKCRNVHTLGGGTTPAMTLGHRWKHRSACPEQSSMDMISFKRHSMSLGLVLLEEKLFSWMQSGTYSRIRRHRRVMPCQLT